MLSHFLKYLAIKYLNKALDNKAEIELIVGLDFYSTDLGVLKYLFQISNSNAFLKLFCFSEPFAIKSSIFHPKLYIFRNKDFSNIIVGSSNLSKGGLVDNFEINALITAKNTEEITSDIHLIYNKIKLKKKLFAPDKDYIDYYKEISNELKEKTNLLMKEKKVKELIEIIKAKEKKLPKQTISKEDLFGWLKLVYDKLPETIFSTNYLYNYEGYFKEHYPENKNIKAKIRQQLQFLRDFGFLKNLGRSKWKKIF